MNPAYRWIHPVTARTHELECLPSIDEIGGKAYSIMRLAQAGVPVPTAWVIPIEGCVLFYRHAQQLPDDLVDEVQQLLQNSLPFPIAVRSGAAVSMPGMLRTVLHCTTMDEVLSAIRTVFESWQSPEARLYREKQQLAHLLGTAVVLQQMISTTVAGVMFTCASPPSAADSLVVEAVLGNGETLVSGNASGQRWIVSRQNFKIISSNIETPAVDNNVEPNSIIERLDDHSGRQHRNEHVASLDHAQLRTLCEWGLRIESISGGPVDVEWGLAGDQFWFFQSRPATPPIPLTSRDVTTVTLLESENQRLEDFRQRGQTMWIRHSVYESAPHPTPLSWSLIRHLFSGQGGLGTLYRQLGYSPSKRCCREGFVELFAGEVYVSPERLPDLYSTDFPWGYDRQELVHDPGCLGNGPRRLDLDRVGPWFLLRSPVIFWRMWRAKRNVNRQILDTHPHLHETVLPEFRHWIDAQQSLSIDEYPLSKLIALWKQRVDGLFGKFSHLLLLPGIVGAAALDQLKQELTELFDPLVAHQYCHQLLSDMSVSVLEDMNRGIHQWFGGQGDGFLESFGHRSREDLELRQPTWREVPQTIPRPERSLSPPASRGIPDSRTNVLDGLTSRVRLRLLRWTHHIPLLLADREICKNEWLRGFATVRHVCRLLESATGLGEDLYFLTRGELERFPDIPSRQALQLRRQEWKMLQRLPHPVIIDDRGLMERLAHIQQTNSPQVGVTISSGSAQGVAWLAPPGIDAAPPMDAVVVARFLRPSDVIHWTGVRGVIVEQAAQLSHGAILARQFGLPVVQLHAACQIIRAGEQVLIEDGSIFPIEQSG